MTKRYPNNGMVDSWGKLTTAGQEAVAAYLVLHPSPGAVVFKEFPAMGALVNAQVRAKLYDWDDFHQAAKVAVTTGVMTFNPDMGSKLETHVVWRIRGEVSHLIRAHDRVIRGASMDGEYDGDRLTTFADELCVSDALDRAVEPFGVVCMKRLTAVQRHVIRRHLVDGCSMRELATELGVSRARVGQVWTAAIATIRGERSKRTAAENAAAYRRSKAKRVAAQTPCLECGRLATRSRQLCPRCYVVVSIRDKYPTDQKCGRRVLETALLTPSIEGV